jgi:hypothetical protein
MNDDKWLDLKVKLREKFGDVEETVEKESGEDDMGQSVPTTTETLQFDSPLGRLKMIRTTRPKILDKKTHYHKGAGGAQVEFILSDDEMTHKLEVFKLDEVTGDFLPLDIPADNFSV